jgi:esterase/lipase superfamily enzyme
MVPGTRSLTTRLVFLLALVAAQPAAAWAQPEPVSLSVEGTVRDAGNRAVGTATVELRDDAASIAQSSTDAAGKYRLTLRALPGQYALVIVKGGQSLGEETLHVLAVMEGQVLTRDVKLKPVTRGQTPALTTRPYTIVKVFYGTDRAATGPQQPDTYYNAERNPGGAVQLGTAEVSIPKDHRVAGYESPSIWRLEFTKDPARHIVVLRVTPKETAAFNEELRARVASSGRKEAFVFVHGFLTTFEDAARMTAQLAYDLQFDGAPVMYTWPSGARFYHYGAAEANAEWTVNHFIDFVTKVKAAAGVESVHIIAHSMGNRVVTQAMRLLSASSEPAKPTFNQVLLTAPDIDADVFRQMSDNIRKSAARVTMYVSENDHALIASRKFHSYPRAGQGGKDLVIVPGIETVDVSEVDTSLVGHSYYGDSRSVVTDIYHLLKQWVPAAQRKYLRPLRAGDALFWRLALGK